MEYKMSGVIKINTATNQMSFNDGGVSHLGGHGGFTTMNLPTFDFIKNKFNIKSVIDVGCGPGGMTEYINYNGVYCLGIDGDRSISAKEYILYHDYIKGKLELDEQFDLAYSVEFLEHVEEKYIPNFFDTFTKAKYVFCTAAYPGQGGHHHVNEQYPEYWIDIFSKYDFKYESDVTNEIKKTTNDPCVTRNGLFFSNNRKIENTIKREPYKIDYAYLRDKVNYHYDGCGKNVVCYDRWI
jgi:SAM-dependent methyltransferase